MKRDKHLDEQIREALENLEAGYDPATWDMLEQRLDASAGEDVFDKMVVGRLAGLEVAPHQNDWELLEQRIEAEEAAELIENEATIDNLAYEKLNRLEIPYQSNHWRLMAKRLEEEYSLRRLLYRYKVAEVALMLLLLLTIIRFLPFAEDFFLKEDESRQIEQFQLVPQQPAESKDGLEKPNTPKQIISPAPGTPVAEAHPSADDGKIGFKNRMPNEVSSQGKFSKVEAVLYSRKTANPSNLPLTDLMVFSQASHLPLSEILRERNFRNNTLVTPGISEGPRITDLLAAADPVPVQQVTVPALILPKTIAPVKRSLRFSIFAAGDLNYVFTPSDRLNILDTLIATDSDTTAASGYGGGILVSFKKGRWEVQTGGVYSFKRYVPNTPVFFFETVKYYVEENFHGIQQDILQTPLNLQYFFKNSGNWRLYGLGGASAHFITSSVYEIRYKRTPTFNIGVPPVPGEESKSIRQQKEFPEGLLDGGNLSDNFYITANLGFGIERFVAPRWSLFFQPNYQHYLMTKGIGTNKDKFYTLSFYLGTKVSLK